MISYRGIGVSPHSYHDTSSEVGVTSVITPLSIRRGAGGEVPERLRHTDITEAFQLRLAVTFCEIG